MGNKFKSSATVIPVDQAVGTILAHDITEIRPGNFKGPAFKKGHIVTEEDIPHLKRVGKEHLYVLHLEPGEVHEDNAALALSTALSGPGVVFDPNPSEGKISLKAGHRGLLKVNVEVLTAINLVPDISCSSRNNSTVVEKGEIIAAVRAIPLVIDETLLKRAVELAEEAGGIFSVKLLTTPMTGIVITGNEVYNGLIDDKFAPIIREIHRHLKNGAEMLIVAGGMSVDPDDITRVAIAEAGAEDMVYGTPVIPGAMFLAGRIGNVPILGLPACVLFYRATVLDLILPRVLAGETITREDLAGMAHGGLCLNCETCRFPRCSFGK